MVLHVPSRPVPVGIAGDDDAYPIRLREHPDLLPAYQRLYPGSYTPKQFQETLRSQVQTLKRQHHLGERPSPVIQPEERPRQMTLGI